jgi:hypothetical protein
LQEIGKYAVRAASPVDTDDSGTTLTDDVVHKNLGKEYVVHVAVEKADVKQENVKKDNGGDQPVDGAVQ